MAKFRKKPVVIEALQWSGHDVEALAVWASRADLSVRKARGEKSPTNSIELPLAVVTGSDHVEIKTLEGVMIARPGDWIICGVKGEFYPCKADIFAATYEAV